MKKKKLAIIGCFGEGKQLFDGQTVSTRLLGNVLDKSNAFKKICKVDTCDYQKRKLKVLFSWLACMFSCKYIIVMLSGNGLKVFSPLLYYANKIFRRKIYHRVIGGELDSFLVRNPKCIKYMNSFELNWVQSCKLVKKLDEIGLKNAEYLENFREITPICLPEGRECFTPPFEFCTFSRVTESKGISVAIEAIAEVNQELGDGTAILHVYGPVEEEYAEKFYSLVSSHENCVEYKGSVPSEKAVETLKEYYMHLFPTTWSGEGFPGTLIDCYNAALPTIASDWAYNPELIIEGETGYLYDWQQPEKLKDKIVEAIQKKTNTWQMKENCLQEAEKYKSETVTAKIVNRIINR